MIFVVSWEAPAKGKGGGLAGSMIAGARFRRGGREGGSIR